MLRSLKLFFTFLVLFIAATVIRFSALIWYPGYIGPAHLISSILLGLAAIPIVLLVLLSRSVAAKFAAANLSPRATRSYVIIISALLAVMTFLGTYYGRPPLL
jgi:hypothetical protein